MASVVFLIKEALFGLVHLVHSVHLVHLSIGGHGLGLLDDFADHRLAKSNKVSDFAVGFAFPVELDDILGSVHGLELFLLAEMLVLAGVFQELKVGVAAGFLDFID